MFRSISGRLSGLSSEFLKRLFVEASKDRAEYARNCYDIRHPHARGIIEQLEERRMLAAQIATLITNGPIPADIDGAVAVTVDPYGGFGSTSPASQTIFNPPGSRLAQETVYFSGLYFSPLGNFLSEDTQLTEANPQPAINFDSQTTTSAVSHFSIMGTDGIPYNIQLTQTLAGYDQTTQRATLNQTYVITNASTTATATGVTLDRYLLSDENWNANAEFDDDFGARSGDGRQLDAFDTTASGSPYVQIRDSSTDPYTGYVGTPEGDPNITPAYTIQEDVAPNFAILGGFGGQQTFGNFYTQIIANNGIPAGPTLANPSSTDDINTFSDEGAGPPPTLVDKRGEKSGTPESLVMQNTYGTIAPGGSITFSTSTDWGMARDSSGNDESAGTFVNAGTFDITGTQVTRTVAAPGTVAPTPATVTITRAGGSHGSVDVGVATFDLDATAYVYNTVTKELTPNDYIPLGQSMSGYQDVEGNVVPLDSNGAGVPSGITFLHFADGQTKETLDISILPSLVISGEKRIEVDLFGSFHNPEELSLNPTNGLEMADPSLTSFTIPPQPPFFEPVLAGEVAPPNATPTLDFKNPNLTSPTSMELLPGNPFPEFWAAGQTLRGDPDNATFTNIIIAPSGDAGSVHFDQGTQSDSDAAHTLDVQVDRDQVPDLSAQISYTFTVSGTAVFGTDFNITGSSGDFTFDPSTMTGTGRFEIGDATSDIPIQILTDLSASGNRSIILTITTAAPATIGSPSVDTVVINDTVFAGTFQFAAPTFTTNEKNGTGTLTVLRTGGSAGSVTLPYTLTDGTAVNGINYSGTGGTITFADGQTSASISVPVLDDHIITAGTSLNATLGPPSTGDLGSPSSAVLDITDADATSNINFAGTTNVGGISNAAFSAREDAGFATITVTRTGDLSAPATVDYATTAGSAVAGFNYVDTHGTLQFPAGAATAAFQVQILDDGIVDDPGTVNINLTNATGQSDISGSSATLTILNADSTFQFAQSGYTANENDGSVTLTVTRNGDTTDPGTVNFSTADESGIAGQRYVATAGTLTFNPGDTSKTFSVQIIDDVADINPTEDFAVSLSSPSGFGTHVSSPSTANVEVDDVDRSKPVITGVSIATPTGSLERIVLKFSKPLNASTATSTANYKIFTADKNGRFTKAVRVSAALYNASNDTVTLLPLPRIAPNTTLQVTVRGPGGVMDTSGRFLAPSVAGNSSNFTARIAFGNKVTYTDRKGNQVSLALTGKRKGTIIYTATTNPVAENIQLTNAFGDTLTGSIKGFADGITEINSISGSGGVLFKLNRTHFKIDKIS